MNKIKRKSDINAITPFVALMVSALIIGGIGIAAIGVYQLTQRPDITYNITDTGFSLAGLEIDSLWIIVIGAVIFFGFIWFAGRKKQ